LGERKDRGVYTKGKGTKKNQAHQAEQGDALSLADRRFKADGRVTAEEGDTLQAIKKILG